PGGTLWAGTSGGLAYFSGGRFFEVLTADGKKLTRVLALVKGPDGAFWAGTESAGLYVNRDRVAHPLAIAGQQNDKNIYRLHLDRDQVLWAGYFQGGISSIRGNKVKTYGEKDGVAPGAVTALAQDRSGAIWVGTNGGLSRFRNGAWTTWTTQH